MALQGTVWGLGISGLGNAEGVVWAGIDHVIQITSLGFQRDGIADDKGRGWILHEILLASSSSAQEIVVVAVARLFTIGRKPVR
ncbi:hypothetical protein BOTCAL_0508g00010 [Botryotinia calthae]|uniref:Uncharacterized protein n=1 Tax=Botryotinia calthae TaxID=38488 RepID=A0A4Y8CNZ3_9HELO|nr:hypothetical protein BOTCAL_0508g00010 [Botryotinia calthae]